MTWLLIGLAVSVVLSPFIGMCIRFGMEGEA